ncbi:MAG TPA: hypothetical protein VGR47_13650 [Terracidiphilus sp.]|nr:hypothetical protein [Terracidiphilus sp.]
MSRFISRSFLSALSLLCLGMAACSAVTGTVSNSVVPEAKSPSPVQSSGPTVTLASLTSNNTAACPSGGTLPAWCQTPFTGQTDSRTGVVTQQFDPPAGNVSTEDIHGYLANGAKTKVFANFMLGFCINKTSTYCSNNVQTGYVSNNAATVAAQSADLVARHFDGAAMSWDGAGTSADSASLLFQSWDDQNACSGSSCQLSYLIMYNFASMNYNVKSTGIPGTSGASCSGLTGATYENCVIAHIRNDMCWMNGKHWGNLAYQKLNGQPILQIFPDEGVIPLTGPAPSWADVWVHIQSWNSNLPQNCAVAPYNADNGVPLVVFENVGGFTHQDSSGSFYWIEPAGSDLTTDQFIYNIGPQGGAATLDTFLADSLTYSGDLVWTNSFKGFNSIQANWGNGRIMDQQCGKTWIDSLTESNSYFQGGIPWLHISTWNDYNEGTEIETGIDNCYTVSTGVTGNSLKWQLNASSSNATLSTVAHVEIYDSLDGTNLSLVGTQAAAASGTYSLNNLTHGTHTLFVRMIGKNSIINRMSSGVTYKN